MNCPHRLRSMALADGQLQGVHALLARWHLQHCALCQAQQGDIELMTSMHLSQASKVTAPPHLRARILAVLDGEPPRESTMAARRARRPSVAGFRAGFLSGAVAAGVVSVAVLMARQAGVDGSDALVAEHIAALHADVLVQMPSGDRHTVRPWLSRHADVSPPVPDLSGNGFQLVGGRTAKLSGMQVAVVSYQYRQHIIDLYSSGARWSRPRTQRRGYQVRCWSAGDLSQCAVSDVAPDVLEEFVRLQRRSGTAQTEDR